MYVDVNECETIRGLCEQDCQNTWGSYKCTCGAGYTLSSDQRYEMNTKVKTLVLSPLIIYWYWLTDWVSPVHFTALCTAEHVQMWTNVKRRTTSCVWAIVRILAVPTDALVLKVTDWVATPGLVKVKRASRTKFAFRFVNIERMNNVLWVLNSRCKWMWRGGMPIRWELFEYARRVQMQSTLMSTRLWQRWWPKRVKKTRITVRRWVR